MGEKGALSEREKLFCLHAARGAGGEEAAVQAGYSPRIAARRAAGLLLRAEIREEVERCQRALGPKLPEDVLRGLWRAAFGPCNDGVRLALGEAPPTAEEIAAMDLYCVSEIRRPKGGGCEVKFVDRLRALELLLQCGAVKPDRGGDLVKALEQSAAALGGEMDP